MMHFVRKAAEAESEPVGAGTDTWKQVLIGPEEGPNFQLRRFRIEPAGSMPLHTNAVVQVRIGDETYDVGLGDVVLIPAGVPHSYATVGKEPFEFLCIVPNGPDRIELLG
jgi:quercetin dioxygenase-like cupin family protein